MCKMKLHISQSTLNTLKEINALIIYSNNKIAIIKPYSGNSIRNCTKDLLETFIPLFEGILNIIIFPFKFIYQLYSFLPIIRFVSENENRKVESVK